MYSEKLKSWLEDLIVETSMNTDFIRNPMTDFTRSRKLGFTTIFNSILAMGGNSLDHEMLELFEYKKSLPTASAFVQARDKILPSAFSHVFNEFNKLLRRRKNYRGYNLLAADGTSINIFTDTNDLETYQDNGKNKGHNRFVLTALYDLCNNLFIDNVIQPLNSYDERSALIEMIPDIDDKSIVVLDRGYESYNVFAHCEENSIKYLSRVKDIDSNGILSGLKLPDKEIDEVFTVNISKYQKKCYKALHNFKFSPSISTFDFSTKENPIYQLSFRVLRIKLDSGNYESIITNLGSDFSSKDIKYLYQLRWGVETSFRQLKYAIGLSHLHAKKKDSIFQEIYARLTLHNFCESIVQNTIIHNCDTSHSYKINFTRAVQVCRKFLRLFNTIFINVEALISRYLSVIRKNRIFNRDIHPKKFTSFLYRIS